MAVTRRDMNIQEFRPMWPALSSLAKNQVGYTYDRATDTLFDAFYGESRPGASVPLDRGDRDYLFLRVDPETDAVVGLQIEHFLSYAIDQHPELMGALDVATLVGIDRGDLWQVTDIESARRKAGDGSVLIEDIFRLSA